jgi:hypothetical protein
MKLKIALLSIALTMHQASATFRSDIVDVESKSKIEASKFPYSGAIGLIMSESGEIATGFMINKEMVITTAHCSFIRKPNEKQVFVRANQVERGFLPETEGSRFNLGITLKHLDNIHIPYSTYTVKKEFCKFEPFKKSKVDFQTFEKALDGVFQYMDKFLKPEDSVLSEKKVLINNTDCIQIGSDLCVLKLDTPLPLKEGQSYIPLQPFDPNLYSNPEATILGFTHLKKSRCDGTQETDAYLVNTIGKQTITAMRSSLFLLKQDPIFNQKHGVFYSPYYSHGGKDNLFTLFPDAMDDLEGLIYGGQSGGPVFFKTDKGEWILGAVVSTTYTSGLIDTFQSILKQIAPKGVKALNGELLIVYKATLKSQLNFMKTDFPIYNVHTALTQEIIEEIKKL